MTVASMQLAALMTGTSMPLAGILDWPPDWTLLRNFGIGFVVVLWLATAFWTFKDARRRIGNPLLVALATLLGLGLPFAGPIIYMFFRPPEYLQDVHERALEIQAMEERLVQLDQRCPVCRARVESTYLLCPVCTTRLKAACSSCGQPLDALWQVCPHCATPVEHVLPTLEDVSRARSLPQRRELPE
ncbi:MAG: zinc ribbon domain-containing protein [Actinomycetota bacterium]|nr:zinc ribbon domain-containing protein [Actinomycetota bacterium]